MNAVQPYRAAFITDLDGTLLRVGHGISVEDYTAFAGLADHNVVRVIATGRALHSVTRCLSPDFPADYLLASSGNQIINWRTGEVLHSRSMSATQAVRAQQVLKELNLCFMLHRDFPNNQHFNFYCGAPIPEDFTRRMAIHAQYGHHGLIDEKHGPVSQFVVIAEAERWQAVEQLRTALPDLSVIRATSPLDGQSIWIEIFDAQVSKASGTQHLLDHLGFTDQPLGAIGNDYNDTDMLDIVHYPYVVPDAFIDTAHDTCVHATDKTQWPVR